MALKFVLFTLAVISLERVYAEDYCAESYCPDSSHIACNNNGSLSSNCVNAVTIDLTTDQKTTLVKLHNSYRNTIAGGLNSNFDPACKMATMQWDATLAQLAQYNVNQCELQYDCHYTSTYQYSGQNIAWIPFEGTRNLTVQIPQAVELWYNDYVNTTMAEINSFPVDYTGPSIGRFTAMVKENNNRLGCAAITYAYSTGIRILLITCNYATTNMEETYTYSVCSTAASECTSGTNRNQPYLCSINESYDVNAWI